MANSPIYELALWRAKQVAARPQPANLSAIPETAMELDLRAKALSLGTERLMLWQVALLKEVRDLLRQHLTRG